MHFVSAVEVPTVDMPPEGVKGGELKTESTAILPEWNHDYSHIYYVASLVSEHVYKMVDGGLPRVLAALDLSGLSLSEEAQNTVQVSRLDVDQKYMILETCDSVYVGMMGTKSVQDALVDGQLGKRQLPFSTMDKGVAHAGFLKRAMDIPIHALYEYASELRGKMLIVCGHSLGGAVASLAVFRLLSDRNRNAFDRVMCITFGSPGVYEQRSEGKTIPMEEYSDGMINFLAEDDPLFLMTKVSIFKHIGRVWMLPRTGSMSADKHRMRYYRRYVSEYAGIQSSRDRHARVSPQGGVVVPPLAVRLVEGRWMIGEGSLHVDLYGRHLRFVRMVYLISSSAARSGKYLGRIRKQNSERITILFSHVDDDTLPRSHNMSVILASDFEVSTYPVRMKWPVIWVVPTHAGAYNGRPSGRHFMTCGAHVWDLAVAAGTMNTRFILDVINLHLGGTLEHILHWIERIKISRAKFMKGNVLPSQPDGIIVMGRVEESIDIYHALYRLYGTVKRNNNNITMIYCTEEKLPEGADLKLKILTGLPYEYMISSKGSIKNAVEQTLLLLKNQYKSTFISKL